MAKIASEFNIHASAKDLFFDRARVINAISAENHKRLSKAGAFIRQRARTAILRRRKRVSKPGEPPSVRSRDSFANLRNILFFLSKDWESVVIGPRVVPSARLKRSNRRTVPELLEKGGTSMVTKTRLTGGGSSSNEGVWLYGDRKGERWKDAEKLHYMARYQPRPFMGPALDAEIKAGSIGNLWVTR